MQVHKIIMTVGVLAFLVVTSACGDAAKTDETQKADSSATTTSKKETPSTFVYNASLDPLIAGAAFSKKISDTLGFKMFEVTLKHGDSIPMHAHPDHAIYILEPGTVLLYTQGRATPDTLTGSKAGDAWIGGPYTDAVKNIGKTQMRFLEIDFYRPGGRELPVSPAYDSTTDALTLGGESIKVLADTLGIKLFTMTLKPGDTATMHSHPDHSFYVLEGGELAVSFKDGPRTTMKLQKGMGMVNGPVSDAAKNTGKSTLKLLMAHVYRPR